MLATALESARVSLFYCILCFSVQAVAAVLYKASVKNVSKDLLFQVSNRVVAGLHATLMSAFAFRYWVYINPVFLYRPTGSFEKMVLDIMMGYLWYDLVIEIRTSCQFDTLAHHFIGLGSHISTRLSGNDAAFFYSMLVYIAEFSTPFLHSSWYLHTTNQKDGIAFLLCSMILLITFFFCRVILSGYIVWHLYTDSIGWGDGYDWLMWGNRFVLLFFCALNVFWFYKLLVMAFGKKDKGKGKEKAHKADDKDEKIQ